jgi:hypothetical protein
MGGNLSRLAVPLRLLTSLFQLVPIGMSDVHAEYLCVVSREYPESENHCPIEQTDRAQFLQKKAMREFVYF